MLKKISFLLILSSVCFSQELRIPQIAFSPKRYICYNSGEALKIDGRLDEAAWSKAVWTDDFVDIEGSLKPLPRFRTRAKMLWDENYFYVAAEIEEPDIFGTVTKRDDVIFRDNDFEVFIDPGGRTQPYAEFEMNALNTVWDLLLLQPYRDTKVAAVNAWDYKGLKTAVTVQGTIDHPSDKDRIWTVEIAFPMASFKEIAGINNPPKENDQWRVNFSRVEWKTEVKDGKYQKQINPATNKPYPEDNWVWSPQGVVDMHYPEMWGFVQFTREVAGGRKVAFTERKEEAAKWFLRQIYYKERNYFAKNGKYSSDLKELGLKEYPVAGYMMPPKIECTSDMFEASLLEENATGKISIRNDGLTWNSGEEK